MELPSAKEFFEIFKTPWEPAKPLRHYPVLLSCGQDVSGYSADVHLIFSSREAALDCDLPCVLSRASGPIPWAGLELPVYGDLAAFQTGDRAVSLLECNGYPVAFSISHGGADVVRLGYDLFKEVSFLLSKGQPQRFATTPTLDLHVSLLRRLILLAGVPLVEIAARPSQIDFICCLTHDIDFHDITRHRFDATMWGFLYRATVGSLIAAVDGRKTWKRALANWKAAALLPFVHLGWARDPWKPFRDYKEVEDSKSTFFVIPFADRPGRNPNGKVEALRASKYGAADIEDELTAALDAGHEIAVHGIEAWRDAGLGKVERARLNRVTGREASGLRMHWLYFDDQSPVCWEEAGFAYDSSFGYNDAVGFRSGTGQVFRPLGASELLELPLNIQDTALFFPDRMNLTESRAKEICRQLIRTLNRFGGVLTVNWHDRSLAPERQWKDFYISLLSEIGKRRVWFAKASEAVDWFAKRRAIEFHPVRSGDGRTETRVLSRDRISPPVLIRTHRPSSHPMSGRWEDVALDFVDEPFAGGGEQRVALPAAELDPSRDTIFPPGGQAAEGASRKGLHASAPMRGTQPVPQKQR